MKCTVLFVQAVQPLRLCFSKDTLVQLADMCFITKTGFCSGFLFLEKWIF